MTTPTISDYLKYANLQIAAEAFLVQDNGEFEPNFQTALIKGNEHASKFTETQATEFLSQWEIVAQKSNTGTGFSGTVFRCRVTDPAKGLVEGQFILSFRSTEFIEDAVRDNQATNKMEVKEHGWAFGQIDDMEAWYAELRQPGGKLAGQNFTVTGYSLGAHLATAFNLLHPTDADATYTFNGAGVGDVSKPLAEIIADFDRMRKNTDGHQIVFTDTHANLLYREWRDMPATTWNWGRFELEAARATLVLNLPEKNLLLGALKNMQYIQAELIRVEGITDTKDTDGPRKYLLSDIASFNLDYQVAMLTAAQSTSSYRTNVVLGGLDAIGERNKRFTFPDCYDLYGANPPSGVSNSQWHYGQTVPIFIEDQPLVRGNIIATSALASALYSDVKLLQNDFTDNDFGDTHSLVLIVDSLSIMSTLSALDPTLTTDKAASLFKAASAAKKETSLFSQGKAEGDVLENLLDALVNTFSHTDPQLRNDPKLNTGGTWADETLRKNFYEKLDFLQKAPAYINLIGKVTVTLPDTGLATAARTDFASLLTLITLSPVAIKAKAGNEAAVAAALAANWTTEHTDWTADQALTAQQRAEGQGNYTEHYLTDRALFLTYIIAANLDNTGSGKALRHDVFLTDLNYFEDKTSGLSLQESNPLGVGSISTRYLFGSDGNDTYFSGDEADHLYGGAGMDRLDGGKGADYLEGNAGADILSGGEGADTVLGGSGIDILTGGQNNDLLNGGLGDDTYVFTTGDGWDTITDPDALGGSITFGTDTLNGGKETIAGTGLWQSADHNYTYTRTSEADGSQTLTIASGTDRLFVKNFTDGKLGITLGVDTPVAPPVTDNTLVLVDTTPGDDPNGKTADYHTAGSSWFITGTDNNDWIIGGTADDRLEGRGGSDRLEGNGGNDRLYAESYIDTASAIAAAAPEQTLHLVADALSGGTGNDLLVGRIASNLLFGGAGSDTLIGGGDVDILEGDGLGLSGAPLGTLTAGVGYDPIAHRTSFYVTQTIDGVTTRSARYSGLSADGAADTLIAGGGNDIAVGDSGDDYLALGQGADIGLGGASADTLDGGLGNDTLFGDFNWDAGPAPDGETENERLIRVGLEGAYHGNDLIDGGAGDDWIQGNGLADVLYGGSGDDRLEGDDGLTPGNYHGNDSLDGGAGNDTLLGDGGDDTLWGGNDNDQLSGDNAMPGAGHGKDLLDGGQGNDTLWGDGSDDALSGGLGNDYLEGDYSTLEAAFHGKDTLDGGQGNDQLLGDGNDDRLYGGAGNDTLYGDSEGETLIGNDLLDGGEDDDTLHGNRGDDTLLGGTGNDGLCGDAGHVELFAGTRHGRNAALEMYDMPSDPGVGQSPCANDNVWRKSA